MRLLFVNPSPVRGGAEQMLAAFLAGFDPARIHAEVACLSPGPFPDELAAAGAAVHMIPAGRMRQAHRWAGAVRSLASLARGFDVVCSWQVKGHYYGTPAARLARRPATWWDHGIRPVRGERSAIGGGLVPRALGADMIFTSSAASAARHARARAIHPGIDLASFGRGDRSAIRAAFGFAESDRVAGIVGRLQPWKGQHVFVRAAARLAGSDPSLRFLVVGDAIGGFSAGYPAEVRALASSLGIEDRVVFAGERRDVPAVLPAMDVFVHASEQEPFGIVILEAMAAGVPVVATRGGGVPEIVNDGETGLLVGHGDVDAMASAIERVIGDRSLAAALARAGRARVESHFTSERMVEDFTESLEALAPRRERARA